MGAIRWIDDAITRSAYRAGKRRDALEFELREKDATIRMARIAAGLEKSVEYGLFSPKNTDSYDLVRDLTNG